MLLSEVFDKQLIQVELKSGTKDEAFKELVTAISKRYPELDSGKMLAAIQDRESKLNTSVMPGVAVPHGCYQGANDVVGAIGVSRRGIEYGAPDSQPVYVVFLIVMGERAREKHLHVLSKVLALLNAGGLSYIRDAKSALEIYDLLCNYV